MTKERKHTRNHTVSAREFVEAWQTSASAGEVADKLGVTKASVHQRVHSYRKQGVLLKHMPAVYTGARVDWDDLREYAETFNTGEEAE